MPRVGPATVEATSTSLAPAATEASRTASSLLAPRTVNLVLTVRTTRYLWFLIILVQVINSCSLFIVSFFYIHSCVNSSDSLLSLLVRVFLTPTEQDLLAQNGGTFGVVYALLGGCFMVSLLHMIWTTLRKRRVSFDTMRILSKHISLPQNRLVRCCRDLWVRFGIRGDRFDEGFVIREIIEMSLQITQAYAITKSISSPFLNQSLCFLIAINSLMHPVIAHVYSHRPEMKRFACVLGEFFLDFAWGTLLPWYVLIKYKSIDRSLTIDRVFKDYPTGFYEHAQLEARHLIVLTWPAFCLSIFPAVSALISLRGLRRLLVDARRVAATNEKDRIRTTSTTSEKPHESLTKSSFSAGRNSSDRRPTISLSRSPMQAFFVRWCHIGITIAGIAIWIVSLASTSLVPKSGRIPDNQCIHRLSPWFTRKQACVVVMFNCPALGITGSPNETNDILESIHLSSLGYLMFDGCTALELPTSLAQADSLATLFFLNTTLLDWPSDIALNDDNFPHMISFGFADCLLASPVPPGLIEMTAWPSNLEQLLIMTTDINELTKQVTSQWRAVTSWVCASCGLTTFPDVFFSMPKLKTWIIFNSTISDIPTKRHDDNVILWPKLQYIVLTYNLQLTSIGDDIWRSVVSGSVEIMSLAFTNVSSVPTKWQSRLQASRVPIYGFASPLCWPASGEMARVIPSLDCRKVDFA